MRKDPVQNFASSSFLNIQDLHNHPQFVFLLNAYKQPEKYTSAGFQVTPLHQFLKRHDSQIIS